QLAGDFNGDGHLDLAFTDNVGVQIVFGNGDGTFQPAKTVATGIGGHLFVAGGGEGDRPPPLRRRGASKRGVSRVLGAGNGDVSVLLGNGDGTFQPQVTYAEMAYAFALATGDFTGDGPLDLAIANSGDNTVSVLFGNGDGTFQQQNGTPNAVGRDPRDIVAGDFTGDGRLDLAVANYSSGDVSLL